MHILRRNVGSEKHRTWRVKSIEGHRGFIFFPPNIIKLWPSVTPVAAIGQRWRAPSAAGNTAVYINLSGRSLETRDLLSYCFRYCLSCYALGVIRRPLRNVRICIEYLPQRNGSSWVPLTQKQNQKIFHMLLIHESHIFKLRLKGSLRCYRGRLWR